MIAAANFSSASWISSRLSICSFSRKQVSTAWCNCSQTPAALHSRRHASKSCRCRAKGLRKVFPWNIGVQHKQDAIGSSFIAHCKLARTASGRRYEGWDQGLQL